MNDLGIQKKEMVAISGPNSAEWMMLWFALDGVGGSQSFINFNLTGNALTHSIKVSHLQYKHLSKTDRYSFANHDTFSQTQKQQKS